MSNTSSHESCTVGAGSDSVRNHAPRAGVGEHVIDLGRRGPGVHRHRNHAQPAASVDQLEVLGFVGEERGKSVARTKSTSAKGRSDSADTIVKLSKGRMLTIGTKNGWTLRVISSGSAERVHVHHCRNCAGRWCFTRNALNASLRFFGANPRTELLVLGLRLPP